ncbi:MAG: hypothetical protein HC836_39370 [Richelia sp. RM2_1_2]|nr:hypothetical protein [Richelia sp. RM2_1_2]
MNFLAILQAIAFCGYIIYLWRFNKGPLTSISSSWYVLQPVHKSHYFNIFCGLVGAPMLAYGDLMNEQAQHLFVLAGFSMWGLGVASMTKSEKWISILHYVFTIAVILLCFAGIYYQYNDYYYFIAAAVGTIVLAFVPKPLWWIELWIFAVIMSKLIPN